MRYSECLAMIWGLGSGISVTSRGKRTNEGSRIVYITEKLMRQHAQNTTLSLFAASSLFRLTGWFHIHLFFHSSYLSKTARIGVLVFD